MIRRRWREPNFECRATDLDGHERRWVTHGGSAQDVRARVEAKGWTVHDVRPYDFARWSRRAQQALVASGDAYRATGRAAFTDGVWGDLKQHLFELFDGKCAYCEVHVLQVDQEGQVEHYRPRRRVTGEPAHPGYWWLAYEIENLLPTCGLCNGASNKGNRFPLDGGARVSAPGPLGDERPLLLHPYEDEPQRHLAFLATGDVEGRTERGRRTIEICGLRRLRDVRAEAQQQLVADMRLAGVVSGRSMFEACKARVLKLADGAEPFAMAKLQHLGRLIAEERERVAEADRMLRDVLERADD
jgi:uncharacterized protein (TIGR02646 family)